MSLSEDERLAYFKDYTDSLRIAAEEQEKAAKEAQELQERLAQTSTMSNINRLTSLDSKASFKPNKFYFYNETTVAYGKNQFQKIWGKRTFRR